MAPNSGIKPRAYDIQLDLGEPVSTTLTQPSHRARPRSGDGWADQAAEDELLSGRRLAYPLKP